MSPETQIEYFLGLYVTKYHPEAAAAGNLRERWWKKDLLTKSWRLMVEDKEILEISEIELMNNGVYLPELPKPKPKACTHENKLDITRMISPEPEWICNDCGVKHEAPASIIPELDDIDKLTAWVREQELMIWNWKRGH